MGERLHSKCRALVQSPGPESKQIKEQTRNELGLHTAWANLKNLSAKQCRPEAPPPCMILHNRHFNRKKCFCSTLQGVAGCRVTTLCCSSQFKGTAHHVGQVKVAEASSTWPRCSHAQERSSVFRSHSPLCTGQDPQQHLRCSCHID